MLKEIKEWVITIVIALIVVVVVRTFLLTQFVVEGASMAPTFIDGDRVFVSKISYNLHDVDHGDVIVFDSNEGDAYIKRVVGVPGDYVEMKDKEVYVNGEHVDETYVSYKEDSYSDNFTLENLGVDGEIPEGEYLVLGDNRPVSKDSRQFGLIEDEQIIGKVFIRFWPFSEITMNFSD